MLFAIAEQCKKDGKLTITANLVWAPTVQEAIKAIRLKTEEEGYEVLQITPCQATEELIKQIVKNSLLEYGERVV